MVERFDARWVAWMGVAAVVLGAVWVQPATAQALEADSAISSALGYPFRSEHYTQQDYRQHPQNWEVVQDARGITYVANANGVMEYDGVEWRFIPTPTSAFVRSLDVGADGTVYVGVQGDFGYLAPDSAGQTRFVSLADEVQRRDRALKDVWSTYATSEGVYYQARNHLFRWDGAAMRTWGSDHGFHTSFKVRDAFYVNVIKEGLFRMVGDSLRRAPGGERFAATGIYAMVPFGENRTLIGTREGFFVQGETGVDSIATGADGFQEEGQLYDGTALPNGYVALAFKGVGVVVIDEEARLVQVLGPGAELPDGMVNDVYAAGGMLWMALNSSGVMRAAAPSTVTVYDERTGLNGVIHYLNRHQDTLYAATSSGAYFLDEAPLTAEARQRTTFRQVPGLSSQVWDLITVGDRQLAATDDGVYEVTQRRKILVEEEKAFDLEQSTHHSDRIYAGLKNGLMVLRSYASGWTGQIVPSFDEEIRTVYEDSNGKLWLGTVEGEALLIRFPNGIDAPPQITRFGMDDGLPGGGSLRIASLSGTPLFYTEKGVFRFRPAAEPGAPAFVRDETLLPAADSTHGPLLSLDEGPRGDLWMLYEDRLDIATPQPDGSFEVRTPPSLHFPKQSPASISVEESGMAWVGNGNQLLRYDPSMPEMETGDFEVLIREVASVSGSETLFGGTQTEKAPAATREERAQLEHALGTLRFRFAAPLYNTVTPVEYQYVLEGEDKVWSRWGLATSKTYTNLYEGDYRFRVRARNERGAVTTVASYAFTVLPPWYRTWWAFALYLAGCLLAVAAGVHYRRVIRENQRVREQAALLERERQANERLQEANESLAQANKLRDTFLANTSHELRTPLTAILGFTSVLKEEASQHHREFLGIIEANGQRLLGTLNDLLDIARIRAGMMSGRREKVDVGEAAHETVRMLHSLTDQKNLSLCLEKPEGPAYTYFDVSYLDRVLQNVVGNAIKFTEEGGVTVTVTQDEKNVRVRVADTGIGIDGVFLNEVFDEFKQESTGTARTHEGSGLGLAITARLMKLMDGDIEVKSAKGEGSTFVLVLPRYSDELVKRYEAESGTETAVSGQSGGRKAAHDDAPSRR